MVDAFCHGGATHVGCKREHNEDSCLVDVGLGLLIIADGMGGHQCGEVASRIAVDFIHESIQKGDSLGAAVERAHEIVLIAANEGLGLPGMGATVVALKLHAEKYEVVWVGDSRAYLWDNEQLLPLTQDHSLVQQLLEAGQITEEQAACHPYRNVVTQALGAADLDRVQPGYVSGTLYRGQQILLCSDGLTGEVSKNEISGILATSADEQTKVNRLIQKALDNGGSDNITALLVSALDGAPAQDSEGHTMRINVAHRG